ncbi:hypothetical protein HN587_02220 [Candidatus Woesearchaeota archaeon]|jgi:hypothetical protein|nr:hypothetical protein [Candidatus Woesearchaeota archaeon]
MSELEDARKKLESLVIGDPVLILQAYDVKKTAAIRRISNYSDFISRCFAGYQLSFLLDAEKEYVGHRGDELYSVDEQ